jgi:Icc-related predicted phosphoesterase
MRIAAVGDIHIGADSDHRFAQGLVGIEQQADVLLLAGDLTKCGTPDEAGLVADELAGVTIPIVAVLGNHDYHDGADDKVTEILGEAGVVVLEGRGVVLDVAGGRLGVAGVKGFGGGFAGANAAAFGEPEMKAFIQHTYEVSQRLADGLATLDGAHCDARVALLHYSPTPETLTGERLELYPFLGSGLLAEAIDRAGVDLAIHGHAHSGCEEGCTPGGTPVRNVAMPVISAAYRVFSLRGDLD